MFSIELCRLSSIVVPVIVEWALSLGYLVERTSKLETVLDRELVRGLFEV